LIYQIIYDVILYPIIYIFPAYAANGAPVIFGGKWGPVDMGKKIGKRRIFGDNKTISGTLAALVCGILVGVIEFPFLNFMLPIAVLLSLGTIFGDFLGSFVKRRIGVNPGGEVPILDQYGFFIFALIFALPLANLPDFYGIIFLIILTGILHVFTNKGAHRIGLKKVPW